MKVTKRTVGLATLVTSLFLLGTCAFLTPEIARWVGGLQLDLAAERVVADLKLARTYAMSRSTNNEAQFSPHTDSYRISNVEDLLDSTEEYVTHLSAMPYFVNLASVEFGGNEKDGRLVFNLYGMSDRGGSIVIEALG